MRLLDETDSPKLRNGSLISFCGGRCLLSRRGVIFVCDDRAYKQPFISSLVCLFVSFVCQGEGCGRGQRAASPIPSADSTGAAAVESGLSAPPRSFPVRLLPVQNVTRSPSTRISLYTPFHGLSETM